jgi:hypothetical protein
LNPSAKNRIFNALTAVAAILALTTLSEYCSASSENRQKKQKKVDGLFRVNTDISAGTETLSDIQKKAREFGLDFIVISDQFLVRCEYGIPPFRNLVKISKDQKSVKNFGLTKYLKLTEEKRPINYDLFVIPGIDVAPHYYWENINGKIICRQFSEQMTIFGKLDEEFIRQMPVIHNSSINTNIFSFLTKISPLFLLFLSVIILRKKSYYSDMQGNNYYHKSYLKKITAVLIAIIAIIWTLDNKPFSIHHGFDPYNNYDEEPYQKLIDYVREKKGDSLGIVWSSPEAKSANTISGISLITEKYLDDVVKTYGHNGFAGIYGDARTAHLPGNEWDKMLMEFSAGKRKNPPFIFGEADYHGHQDGLDFDFIKTVVFIDENEPVSVENITKAMLEGHSYAVSKQGKKEMVLDEFRVYPPCKNIAAVSGETIRINRGDKLKVSIRGHCENLPNNFPAPVRISLVSDGKELSSVLSDAGKFQLAIDISGDTLRDKTYLRFYISGPEAGELLSNPIFIQSTK